MSDYISRQEAIDCMMRLQREDEEAYGASIPEGFDGDRAAEALMQLPSVQPQKVCVAEVKVDIDDIKDYIDKAINAERWIPCSERLPDIGEHHVSEPCIVYCSNGAYGFAELEENIFGQVGWNCERDDEYHEPLGEVLAWMPLPEPARLEDEA